MPTASIPAAIASIASAAGSAAAAVGTTALSGLSAVGSTIAGGLGAAGIEALRQFTRAGGSLICLGASGGLAIGTFELPVRDLARENDDRLFVPGSIVRLTLDPSQPLSFGMKPDTAAFFAFSSVYASASATARAEEPRDPSLAAGVKTVAHYGERDVLLSGWLEGE